MAYSNVGTPRWYLNIPEWLNSNGFIDIDPVFRTLPVNENTTPISKMPDMSEVTLANPYIAILGHTAKNIALQGTSVYSIVNGFTSYAKKGFSIFGVNNTMPSAISLSGDGSIVYAASILLGNYYDLPHSPELNLTMSREMDGVRRIRTKGGADLVKHQYTKPTSWGDAGAWELYSDTPKPKELSRSGRRVWDLSFNYLQGSDMFSPTESLSSAIFDTEPYDDMYYLDTYIDRNFWRTENRFLNYNSFFSQVLHKTQGGRLPFIFNPAGGGDNPNNNPDMFAICKFDQNSFSFQQTAPNLYSVKMKIREVW